MARPDWTKPESYPKTPEAWPFRVWAWEFLRRNPEFQRQCDELAEASAGAKQRMARSWGLGEFKPYKEGYFSPSGCLWCWRQFKIDHLCQLNFDQVSNAGFVVPGCG